MKEERDPFRGVGVVGGRAAAEFVLAVDVADELSVSERGDAVDFAGAVKAVVLRFHNHPFGSVIILPLHDQQAALYAGRHHHFLRPYSIMIRAPASTM